MTMKKINILVNDLNKLDNTMAVSIVTGSSLFIYVYWKGQVWIKVPQDAAKIEDCFFIPAAIWPDPRIQEEFFNIISRLFSANQKGRVKW